MDVAQTISPKVASAYHFDTQYRVYSRNSDGLQPAISENSLFSILRSCADRSCASSEVVVRGLESGCRYETDPLRVATLAALDLAPGTKVLEIGTAGGTITRYLGEHGVCVTALEPDATLAACTAERCRGLDNVAVYSDSIEHFAPSELFDVVVCIDPTFHGTGVLDPIGRLATRARDLLRPTGTLLLATSNIPPTIGEEYVVHTKSSVQSVCAPASVVVEALMQIGFRHIEPLAAFPTHTAPALLVDPARVRESAPEWQKSALATFDAPVSALPKALTWLKKANSETVLDDYAPGYVMLAHRHRVHTPLWRGYGVVQFALQGAEDLIPAANIFNAQLLPIRFNDRLVAKRLHTEGQPRLLRLSSSEAEVQAVRNELQKALARERELYAALAREEVQLRTEYEESLVRSSRLEGDLSLANEEVSKLSCSVTELNHGLEVERGRVAALTSELQSVRLQHQALFKEMCRFKTAAEEALVRVQELQCECEHRKVTLRASQEALIEKSLEMNTLEDELLQIRQSWSWRVGRKLRQIFLRDSGEV